MQELLHEISDSPQAEQGDVRMSGGDAGVNGEVAGELVAEEDAGPAGDEVMAASAGTLTPEQRERFELRAHEIDAGQDSIDASHDSIAEALADIHDCGLYREYGTFNDCVAKRFGMSRSTAYDYLKSYKVAQAIAPQRLTHSQRVLLGYRRDPEDWAELAPSLVDLTVAETKERLPKGSATRGNQQRRKRPRAAVHVLEKAAEALANVDALGDPLTEEDVRDLERLLDLVETKVLEIINAFIDGGADEEAAAV